jgi:hypothetical protein
LFLVQNHAYQRLSVELLRSNQLVSGRFGGLVIDDEYPGIQSRGHGVGCLAGRVALHQDDVFSLHNAGESVLQGGRVRRIPHVGADLVHGLLHRERALHQGAVGVCRIG